RITAIGNYLVALSEALILCGKDGSNSLANSGPPAWRKQLHILFLLNDMLHHAKHHSEWSAAAYALAKNLQPHALSLVKLVSAHPFDIYGQHQKRVLNLLDLWAGADYFDVSYIQNLRDIAREDIQVVGKNDGKPMMGFDRKDAPYIIPASHGDYSTPFYDLPAGNMMPHIIPNSTNPINSQLLKPLQFTGGPSDQNLVSAVKGLIEDANRLDRMSCGEEVPHNIDIDELGQFPFRDLFATDIVNTEGYYGWSQEFCQKMMNVGSPQVFGKGSYYTANKEGSFGPYKKRQYDRSQSTS
ncbi:MAG: hypothetical protein Q9217_007079, partial [Psora testacea]